MEIIGGIIIVLLLVLILMFYRLSITKKDKINNDLEVMKNDLSLELKNNVNEINISLANNNMHILKEISEFKIEMLKSYALTNFEQNNSLNKYKEEMLKELNQNFRTVNSLLESKLLEINKDLNTQLDKNFAKTNTAFSQMIERLAKIDEAQKKIEGLSNNIVSLQDILSDKKSRGAFGEVQLNNIIKSIFGEKQEYYKLQAKLSNGTMADAIINVPDPVGSIAIDSKFPLESYKRMVDDNLDDLSVKEANKQFKIDLKRHIDDISSKYIIVPETTNSAILFLPAEAIFAQINAYHPDIVDYANAKRVWLTSPTTLMATLTSIQAIVQNIEQSKYAKIIQEHLVKLNDEFVRYAKRWDSLSSHIDNVSRDAKDIHTTTKKISNQFERISNVTFDEEVDLIE